MARLVAAFGTSHSIMLAATREDWTTAFRESDRRMPLFDRNGSPVTYDELLAAAPEGSEMIVTPEKMERAYERSCAAVAELKRQMDGIAMDALIVVGDDQHELFQDALMPALAVYYGATIRNAGQAEMTGAGWYVRAQRRRLEPEREKHYPVHAGLALHLIRGLTERAFDVCAVKALAPSQFEGHAFSHVHRACLAGRTLPVVPVMLNTYYPPNPILPSRCVRLGVALKELIEAYPEDLKVGILASGGLSHFVVDVELDRIVIEAAQFRALDSLAALAPERLQAGSSEIRSWIVTAAAAGGLGLKWLEYIAAYRTPALTGIGLCFARWG